jgi:hypothetical protein
MADYASEGGHWYWPDGRTAYEMPNKSKPGEMRPTSLLDARKLGLYCSFSAAEEFAYKPQLRNWEIEQCLYSSEALPRRDGEGQKAWAKRVIMASKEERAKVPELGSAIHAAIEKDLLKQYDYPREYAKHVNSAKAALGGWCGLTMLGIEKSFAHALGYGGKVDVHKPGFVADFKTKTDFTSDGRPPAVWPNHFRQLAAYRHGLGMPTARCAIIYVSTTEPGLTRLIEIDEADLRYGWESFQALLAIWKIEKNYDPVTSPKATDGAHQHALT